MLTVKITSIQGQHLPLGSYHEAINETKNGVAGYRIINMNQTWIKSDQATVVQSVPNTAVSVGGYTIDPINVFVGMTGEQYGAKFVYSSGSTKGMTHDQAMVYPSWFATYGSALTQVGN